MSQRKRRHLSAEFKARVARDAMANQKTIQQIAQDNDIPPTQVSARRPITVGGLRTRNHDCNRGIKSRPTDQLDHQ